MEAFLRIAAVKADSDKAITTIYNIYALVYEQIIMMITQLEEYVTTLLFNAEKDSSMISTVGRVLYAGETVYIRAL